MSCRHGGAEHDATATCRVSWLSRARLTSEPSKQETGENHALHRFLRSCRAYGQSFDACELKRVRTIDCCKETGAGAESHLQPAERQRLHTTRDPARLFGL